MTKRIILIAAVLGITLFSFIVLRQTPIFIPVALLVDEQDSSGAVVSLQAHQSVVLAMEYFNTLSSSRRFYPVPLFTTDVSEAIKSAADKNTSVVVSGIHTPSLSLLSKASKRHQIGVISLAPGNLLARPDDFVFRPRPASGGHELGRGAKKMGIHSYAAIVSGFEDAYVQEFVRDFEAGAGIPPRRTMVFSGDLNKQIEDFERIGKGMDAALLVLPDWLAAIAVRELRLRTPHLFVFASNRAVSHRTPLLAGSLGEGLLTAGTLPPQWTTGRNAFFRFVKDTYGDHIPDITLAMGYDAAAMLGEAVKQAGSADRKAVALALENLKKIRAPGEAEEILVDSNGDMCTSSQLFFLMKCEWVPFSLSPSERSSFISSGDPRK